MDIGFVACPSPGSQVHPMISKGAPATIRCLLDVCSRDQNAQPECVLTRDTGEYHIELATDVSRVNDCYDLFARHLLPTEIERKGRFKENALLDMSGKPYVPYRVFYVRGRGGEIVAAYATNTVRMRGNRGAVFLGAYAATSRQYQGVGFMRELYASALMQSVRDACSLGTTLQLALGECTEAGRRTWARLGRKEPYIRRPDGTHVAVYVVQPPLSFNLATGLPSTGATTVNERMMVDGFGSKVTKDLLIGGFGGLCDWTGRRESDEFAGDNPSASYAVYRSCFSGLERDFATRLNGGTLVLLSIDERAALEFMGVTFRDPL